MFLKCSSILFHEKSSGLHKEVREGPTILAIPREVWRLGSRAPLCQMAGTGKGPLTPLHLPQHGLGRVSLHTWKRLCEPVNTAPAWALTEACHLLRGLPPELPVCRSAWNQPTTAQYCPSFPTRRKRLLLPSRSRGSVGPPGSLSFPFSRLQTPSPAASLDPRTRSSAPSTRAEAGGEATRGAGPCGGPECGGRADGARSGLRVRARAQRLLRTGPRGAAGFPAASPGSGVRSGVAGGPGGARVGHSLFSESDGSGDRSTRSSAESASGARIVSSPPGPEQVAAGRRRVRASGRQERGRVRGGPEAAPAAGGGPRLRRALRWPLLRAAELSWDAEPGAERRRRLRPGRCLRDYGRAGAAATPAASRPHRPPPPPQERARRRRGQAGRGSGWAGAGPRTMSRGGNSALERCGRGMRAGGPAPGVRVRAGVCAGWGLQTDGAPACWCLAQSLLWGLVASPTPGTLAGEIWSPRVFTDPRPFEAFLAAALCAAKPKRVSHAAGVIQPPRARPRTTSGRGCAAGVPQTTWTNLPLNLSKPRSFPCEAGMLLS